MAEARRLAAWRARGAVLAAALAVAACASAPRPPAAGDVASGLGASDFLTQHLYALHGYREGADLRLRLALRIWRADLFDLTASDVFGRPLWKLEVAGDAGAWRDLRNGRRCRVASAAAIDLPGFAVPWAAADLAPLLLGRRPAAADAAARVTLVGGEYHLRLDEPRVELEWHETARATLPASAPHPQAPDSALPLCVDADFS